MVQYRLAFVVRRQIPLNPPFFKGGKLTPPFNRREVGRDLRKLFYLFLISDFFANHFMAVLITSKFFSMAFS